MKKIALSEEELKLIIEGLNARLMFISAFITEDDISLGESTKLVSERDSIRRLKKDLIMNKRDVEILDITIQINKEIDIDKVTCKMSEAINKCSIYG